MIHPFRRVLGSFTHHIDIFGGERDTLGSAFCAYLPNTLTLYDATLACRTAPGGGNGYRMEFGSNDVGSFSQTGVDVDLSDASTSVRTDVSGTWSSAGGSSATAAGRNVRFSAGSGAPSLQEVMCSVVYQDDSDTDISFYGFGDRLQNIIGVTNANRFTTFGVSDSVASVESNVQTPWPIAGTFQRAAIVYSVPTGSPDVDLIMRVNGADVGSPGDFGFTNLSDTGGLFAYVEDTTNTVHVDAGDLVSWRMFQDTGTAGFSVILTCGFVAD